MSLAANLAHILARQLHCGEEPFQNDLRMAKGGLLLVIADQRPVRRAHLLVEPRQDDGALVVICDRRQQARRCRLGASRTKRNHRVIRSRVERRNLRLDQQTTPLGCVNKPGFFQHRRPFMQRNVEKARRDRPISIKRVVNDLADRIRGDIFNVEFVNQRREFGGERVGARRRRRDKERFAGVDFRRTIRSHRYDGVAHRFRPRHDQLRQQKTTLQLLNRRRAMWIECRFLREKRGVFAFLQTAQRQNTRQKGCADANGARKFGGERTAGALGRHVNRGARQR